MKRFWLVALLLALSVPAVIAQEDAADVKVAEGARLMALYDTPGRSWTHRVIHWSRGESPYVVRMHAKLTTLEQGKATVETSHSDDWGTNWESTEHYKTAEPTDQLKRLAAAGLPVETLDMGFRKFECYRHTETKDGAQVTTWTSTEFHPLMVKQTVFSGSDYTICKLTQFQDGTVDPWLLYRKVGRSMKLKVKSSDEGGESFVYATITACDALGADMEVRREDAEGVVIEETSTKRIAFERRLQLIVPEGVDEVVTSGEKEIKTEAGTFQTYAVEHELGTMYYSKTWSELPVKVESKTGSIELVEFNLGHDASAFYRTAGNSYTLQSTSKIGGMNIKNSTRTTVTSVQDGESSYKLASIDENGRVLHTSEGTMPLTEAEGPHMPYDGQIEELVYTPAGALPAVRSEYGETVMWMWNGLVVRMEMASDDFEMVQELTALNMQ